MLSSKSALLTLTNSQNSPDMRAAYAPYRLVFKSPATTSRDTLTERLTYYIKVWDEEKPECFGIGECAIFRGLSAEDWDDYENIVAQICRSINKGEPYDISRLSSVRFGLETALADLKNGGNRTPFPSAWSSGETPVKINGLVWMGSVEQMIARADEKIAAGFDCIKFKVGGVDFNDEFRMIERVRRQYSPEQLEIRLDANGAFSLDNVMERLHRLSLLDIHSIEQPIRQHQREAMAQVCKDSPIPIALDEELIGVTSTVEKLRLLKEVRPAYIILKPSLCGGFSEADDWIACAESNGIGWWATSALESDIGLNAIAQWTAAKNPSMPQGLGTGALYVNNFTSPLRLNSDRLSYEATGKWVFPHLQWI